MWGNLEREERKEKEFIYGLMGVIEKGCGSLIILRSGKLNKFIHNKHKMISKKKLLTMKNQIEMIIIIFKKEEILIQHIPLKLLPLIYKNTSLIKGTGDY